MSNYNIFIFLVWMGSNLPFEIVQHFNFEDNTFPPRFQTSPLGHLKHFRIKRVAL
jgi:hypothetical protein